jgi:ribonuclease Z
MTDFNILVLGSGAATPTHTRKCSAQLLNVCGTKILIDCGESTQNQLRHNHQKIQSISSIFISHLHGDHFFGLPGLISTMHLCGRTEPLTVYAPTGAREAIELLFRISATTVRFELNIIDLDVTCLTRIHEGRNFSVSAFPLYHSIPTFGFLIEEAQPLPNLRPMMRDKYNMTNEDCINVKHGADLTLSDGTVIPNSQLVSQPRRPRRYAYCCDTVFDETIVPNVQGVDLLCMESTFDNAFADMAHERCHLTAAQAATIALQAGAGQLLLTHFSARYRDISVLMDEATAIFQNTLCANDNTWYSVFNSKNASRKDASTTNTQNNA